MFILTAGFPALTRFASVVIRVSDLNDNKPMFYILNPQNVAVEENAPVGKQFYHSGRNKEVTYSITGGSGAKLFIIDRGTSWLSINASFDYETQSSFSLEVAAVDSGIPPLTNRINITVFIKSVDESEPAFVKSDYSFDLPGNAEIGTSSARLVQRTRTAAKTVLYGTRLISAVWKCLASTPPRVLSSLTSRSMK